MVGTVQQAGLSFPRTTGELVSDLLSITEDIAHISNIVTLGTLGKLNKRHGYINVSVLIVMLRNVTTGGKWVKAHRTCVLFLKTAYEPVIISTKISI